MYVAVYTSAVTSTTGCPHSFTTRENSTRNFSPAVTRKCPTCGLTHAFRLKNTFIISTPSQTTTFKKYCVEMKLETDVDLN